MMRTTFTRASRIAGLLAASLLFAQTGLAATIATLGGTGQLSVTSTGAIYFDAGALAATDLLLRASDRIEIGTPLPSGVPDPASLRQAFSDVSGPTSLAFVGDVYFDLLAFSGGVTFLAQSIHVTGQIQASGNVTLQAGNIDIYDAGLIAAGGGRYLCGAGATISTGASGCTGQIGPIGGITSPPITIDGPLIGGLAPVPEPTGALLFSLGAALLVARQRR